MAERALPDLATAALFAHEVDDSSRDGVELRRTSRMLIARDGIEAVEPADASSVTTLSTWRIIGSPSGEWFYNMRVFAGLWASLVAWDNRFSVELVTYNGGLPPCAMLSETWHELESVKQDLLDIMAKLSAGEGTGADYDQVNVCPDSLMSPGQSCLDFYIAAALAGPLDGNNRSTDPGANITQSKVFVVDDFNNGRVFIYVAGTAAFYPLAWRGGLPMSVGMSYFPPQPNIQIRSVEIDAPSRDVRTVTIKIGNALCATWEQWLADKFPGDAPSSAVRAGCPDIDAKVSYERDAFGWRPSRIVRDAFPNLDIFRMQPDRSLKLLHHSAARWERGPFGGLFLVGIFRLIYNIQQEQDKLMNDLTSAGCALQ